MSKGAKKPSLYTLSRLPLSDEEMTAYFEAMKTESDRIVAIRASSFVEHELTILLRTGMREMTETEEETLFFKAHSTFSAFSDRIDAADAFGLITLEQTKELDIIRRVRNTFAHAVVHLVFDNPLIKEECDKLSIAKHNSFPRWDFLITCTRLGTNLRNKASELLEQKTKEINKETQRLNRETEILKAKTNVITGRTPGGTTT
jgi:hypothetical protein